MTVFGGRIERKTCGLYRKNLVFSLFILNFVTKDADKKLTPFFYANFIWYKRADENYKQIFQLIVKAGRATVEILKFFASSLSVRLLPVSVATGGRSIGWHPPWGPPFHYSADLNYPDKTNITWIFKRVFLKLG